MLRTDKKFLSTITTEKRAWQGIPSIEVTPKGRIFLTFYSGGIREAVGNYAPIIVSDDGGKTFREPIAAAYLDEKHRCFDSNLWIDPLGRLWFTWALHPDDGVYGAICDDPDAETLRWGKPFLIGHNVMMNKPTVLRTGEWLFPVAVWDTAHFRFPPPYQMEYCGEPGAYAYATRDNGATFEKLGAAQIPERLFDEHMILELQDGSLRAYVRTVYGIGAAESYDGGKTWGQGHRTDLGGPCSRFHIRRLQSGRILLINHYQFHSRDHLTAMLSEDDGRTFPHRLLLDERDSVSYPDAKQVADGSIYITYDRERGCYRQTLDDTLREAREILLAKITEEDILAGKLVSNGSYLKHVANKLAGYTGDPLPFDTRDTDFLRRADDVLSELFNTYPVHCRNLHNVGADRLDALIRTYNEHTKNAADVLSEMIDLLSSVQSVPGAKSENAIVEEIRYYIQAHPDDEQPLDTLAKQMSYSRNYLQHIFKKHTGSTVLNYQFALRLQKAKLLLLDPSIRIIDVASRCGYDSPSYFSKLFKRETGMTPEAYRKLKVGE